MARTTGDALEPFTVGVSLTNGSASIANYNVFAITVSENSNKNTVIFSRGGGTQTYGLVSTNNGDYWSWFQLSLSSNTFSVSGARGNSMSNGEGGVASSVSISKIYGIV